MTGLNRPMRAAVVGAGLIALWQGVVWLAAPPPYMLPGPLRVAGVWWERRDLILEHGATTLLEICLGLVLGTGLGILTALCMAYFRPARRWVMPLLVASQAVPVFALAPLLVLWLGYGLASKVAMATLIIFFPVASAFHDGLGRTQGGWLDLAQTMGASRARMLWHIRIPAALPALGSGLRVAAAVAPIGAVVGEWVGSSGGLGYLMLHANARMQIDLLFAALLTLAVIAVGLHSLIDHLVRRLVPWSPDGQPPHD